MNLLQNILPAVFGSGPSLPDFLVVGARGPAMNWVHRQLSHHPQIWLPPIGDTHFFTHEHQPERRESMAMETRQRLKLMGEQCRGRALGLNKLRRASYLKKLEALPMHSPDWYRACFSSPTGSRMVKGEISTTYPRLSEEGIRAIKTLIPAVRIVMVLQNPSENVVAGIRLGAARSGGQLSAMDWQRLADRVDLYKDTAHSEILPLWEKVFADEIFYLVHDRVLRDGDTQLKQLLKRLSPCLETPATKSAPRGPEDSIQIPAPILKLVTDRTLAEVAFFKKRFAASGQS